MTTDQLYVIAFGMVFIWMFITSFYGTQKVFARCALLSFILSVLVLYQSNEKGDFASNVAGSLLLLALGLFLVKELIPMFLSMRSLIKKH